MNDAFNPEQFFRLIGVNLSWADVQRIVYGYTYLVPGQKMWYQNGVAIYDNVSTGVSRKGVQWRNSHVLHRENCIDTIRHRYPKWLVGKGIDVGCGVEKVTEDCVGVDNGDDFKDQSEADVFRDITDLSCYADGEFDWLFSSNSIEHVANWQDALTEWVRVVRQGGIVYIYTPWPEKQPLLAAGGPVKAHLWNPSPAILRQAFYERGVDVVECDEDADEYGTFVIVGRKR